MKIHLSILLLISFFGAVPIEAMNNPGCEEYTSSITGKHAPADTDSGPDFLIRPVNLDIAAPSSGVQFYRDGIIFLYWNKLEEKIPEKHLSFGTPKFYKTIIKDTMPGEYEPFPMSALKIFPSEAVTFTKDFNTMYFSLIPDLDDKEKIFKATYSSAGWEIEEKPLEICSDDYIYSHPSISADGTLLIFSSDMKGTSGGLDLFVSRKENDSWSSPQNIGKNINTEGNELFASLDAENNLYFSSDGLPGHGGYDIFVCRYNGAGWDQPFNLSGMINSKSDEIAFTINKTEKNRAFYTVRAKPGRGRIQLYSITLKPSPEPEQDKDLSQGLICLTDIANEAQKINSGDQAKPVLAEQNKSVLPESAPSYTGPAKTADHITPPTGNNVTESPKTEKIQPVVLPEPKRDVIYRVQFAANMKPVGSYSVTVAGRQYRTFEYFHQGGYRSTIGEFLSLNEAVKLQNLCRENGIAQAFVVAFRNNERSNDPSLFR